MLAWLAVSKTEVLNQNLSWSVTVGYVEICHLDRESNAHATELLVQQRRYEDLKTYLTVIF